MDEQRTRTLLAELARRLEGRVLLWRGAELDGGDVDIVVMPDAAAKLDALLRDAGVAARVDDAHRTVWSAPGIELDVLAAHAWPKQYPSLERMLARAKGSDAMPPVATAEDRLLVFASDLLAGRPVEKMLARAEPLLAQPGVRERLDAVAAREGFERQASLIAQPERLRNLARRGRLPYAVAARVAWRSAAGRAALRGRAAARLRVAGRPKRGLLIAVSGMDGAGKSTAADVVCDRVRAHGLECDVAWNRFVDTDTQTLDRIATPVKRLVRDDASVADPVAVRGDSTPLTGQRRHRSLLTRAWVVVVALVNVRQFRRTARRRWRTNLVCDRWTADSLVDLEIRYGRNPLASGILRRGLSTPDLALFVAVDAQTAASRKPGDQAVSVLERMEPLYEARARELGLIRIDGRGSREEVERATRETVERFLVSGAR